MRLNDHYDWIVLGHHPAALLGASLVARLGLSVLILPFAPILDQFISTGGQPLDPEPNYLMGLGRSGKLDGLIRECLRNLKISDSDEKLIRSEECLTQVATQDSRLVFAGNESLLLELQRELGKPAAKQLGLVNALKYSESEFLSYWQRLPHRLTVSPHRKSSSPDPQTLSALRRQLMKNLDNPDAGHRSWLSSKTRVSDFAKELGRPDIIQMCAGLWHGMTSSISFDPTLFELLGIFSLSRTGASFKGGMTGYRQFLLELAKKQGAHVPLNTECRKIFIEKGCFSSVQVVGRANRVSGATGVLGCSMDRVLKKAVFTGKSWLRRPKEIPRPQGWRFTLALTVRKVTMPKKMTSRLVWQEKDAPPLELEVIHPADYGLPGEDSRILYARTILPYTLESLQVDYQRLIAGRMLRQLMEILPYIEHHITQIYPDFRLGGHLRPSSVPSPVRSEIEVNEVEDVYGFSSLDSIPDNLKVYQGEGLGSTSGIQGLSVISEESYPQLGNFGGTVAALEAVARVAHRAGLAGPLA